MAKKTVLSGMRATARLHLGNYFGAAANWVRMQEDYDSYFFVADWHALTTHHDPSALRENVRHVVANYLACGLDPERCTIYIQSDVPEIAELCLYLNMFAHKGELEKTATFKEKARRPGQTLNAGLLTYPVLMAADILIHRADLVPVGKDQEQHLEMTRTFARRFNRVYDTDLLPEPQGFSFTESLVKIPSLDGSGAKMSKSDENQNNVLYLSDDPNVIRKKVRKAKTDAGPAGPGEPLSREVQNLFDLMEAVSDAETLNEFRAAYADGTIRYGDLKKTLAEDVVAFTEPIRDRIRSLTTDDDRLRAVTRQGAERARANAQQTISAMREVMGIAYF